MREKKRYRICMMGIHYIRILVPKENMELVSLYRLDTVLALKSFTLTKMGTNIGIVNGFERVPWVYNIAFQITSKVMIEEVIIPLPRSLIPRAEQKNCSYYLGK